ncbi:MAG: hypothetical protein AAFV53_42690 [Myxococcota bacterium]
MRSSASTVSADANEYNGFDAAETKTLMDDVGLDVYMNKLRLDRTFWDPLINYAASASRPAYLGGYLDEPGGIDDWNDIYVTDAGYTGSGSSDYDILNHIGDRFSAGMPDSPADLCQHLLPPL